MNTVSRSVRNRSEKPLLDLRLIGVDVDREVEEVGDEQGWRVLGAAVPGLQDV
ncbi:MAG TPA: hypothetical protein VIZ60_02480 [Rubrobacter sp.]